MGKKELRRGDFTPFRTIPFDLEEDADAVDDEDADADAVDEDTDAVDEEDADDAAVDEGTDAVDEEDADAVDEDTDAVDEEDADVDAVDEAPDTASSGSLGQGQDPRSLEDIVQLKQPRAFSPMSLVVSSCCASMGANSHDAKAQLRIAQELTAKAKRDEAIAELHYRVSLAESASERLGILVSALGKQSKRNLFYRDPLLKHGKVMRACPECDTGVVMIPANPTKEGLACTMACCNVCGLTTCPVCSGVPTLTLVDHLNDPQASIAKVFWQQHGGPLRSCQHCNAVYWEDDKMPHCPCQDESLWLAALKPVLNVRVGLDNLFLECGLLRASCKQDAELNAWLQHDAQAFTKMLSDHLYVCRMAASLGIDDIKKAVALVQATVDYRAQVLAILQDSKTAVLCVTPKIKSSGRKRPKVLADDGADDDAEAEAEAEASDVDLDEELLDIDSKLQEARFEVVSQYPSLQLADVKRVSLDTDRKVLVLIGDAPLANDESPVGRQGTPFGSGTLMASPSPSRRRKVEHTMLPLQKDTPGRFRTL